MKKGILNFISFPSFKIIMMGFLLFFMNERNNAQVMINEIMVNPSGANDGSNMPNTAEWVELYNTSASSVNIGCWVFTDGDFSVTFPSGASIPAFGYYTIASASGSGFSPNLNWATCGCTAGGLTSQVGIFTNGGEQLLLYNSSGVLQDALIWGGGQLPDSFTSAVVGSCSSQSFTFPGSGSGLYEDIGSSSTDGFSRERSYDGSDIWQSGGSGTFASSNGPILLPVELVNFEAHYNLGLVNLNWITATENNNDYFIIERSRDGISFNELLKVDAIGNSVKQSNYQSKDDAPLLGISYYRLKQVDENGNYTFSTMVSIESEQNRTTEDFAIYPNPSLDGIFKIHSQVMDLVGSDLQVFDASGQLILKTTLEQKNETLDLSELVNGMYLILIETGGSVYYKKIIKLK